jgi:hypothetical protein
MTRPNIGDTVWYFVKSDNYWDLRSGQVERIGHLTFISSWYRGMTDGELYATGQEAKAARLAYYEREAEAAHRALDNARTHNDNMVAWRERAREEMGE